MGTSRALASFWTSVTDHQFRTDHLKLCVLWYDEILVQEVGELDRDRLLEGLLREEGDARKTIRSLTDLVAPLTARVSPDTLRELKESEAPGYPRWGDHHQHYTYPDPETAEEYAHNCLLERIAAEHGVERFTGQEVQLAEGRARVAVRAVQLWDHVNREAPCMLQAGGDEKLAMAAAQKFATGAAELRSAFSLFEVALPSLASVSRARIMEFRRNGALAKLRDRMATAMERAGADLQAAKQALDSSELDALNDLVERARPRPRRVAVEAVLANVPGLPVNPASVYFGARDTVAAIKKQNEFGWLYLLRDIRAAGEANCDA